ncbi:MAG: hypothetical protein RMJ31_04390 [Nitrososphaerota archaeon]|nr:hypothetical protein [Nitrososphaerota archaeon]
MQTFLEPNYHKVLNIKRKYVKKIVYYLSKIGKEVRFSQLMNWLNIPPSKKSTLSNNIDVLVKYGIVERVGRGAIRLRFKTPLCFITKPTSISYAYLGLLGLKEKWEVSETETAIRLLEREGFKFDRILVVTTQRAIGSWEKAVAPDIQSKIVWYTLSEEELNRIDIVEAKVKPKLIELLKDYATIMDCTSGPRPAGIAYYKLADHFRVPLIYVYVGEKELVWLISKEDLKKEFKSFL